MKKIFAIVIALILVLAMFAACGNKDDSAAEAPADTGNAQSDTGTDSTPAPAPDPEAGTNTVTVGNNEYGTITFSFPDDPGIEVTVLDNDIEESLPTLIEWQENIVPSNSVTYVRAHVKGDGWNMVFGFNDYSGDPMKTFKAKKWFRTDLYIDDVTMGGQTGYTYLSDIYQFIFPSATQFAVRVVGVFPEEVPESSSSSKKSEWEESLLEIPAVKEILDTVQFSSDVHDEPPWETTPLESKSFNVTPTDGWEIFSSWVDSIDLKKDGANDISSITGDAAQIGINGWGLNTAQKWMDEKILGSPIDLETKQLPNVTINGREFLAVEYGKQLSDTFAFITSRGESFDPASENIVVISLSYMTDYNNAMKQLENIEIN